MWTQALILAGVPFIILTLTALIWLERQGKSIERRLEGLERRFKTAENSPKTAV